MSEKPKRKAALSIFQWYNQQLKKKPIKSRSPSKPARTTSPPTAVQIREAIKENSKWSTYNSELAAFDKHMTKVNFIKPFLHVCSSSPTPHPMLALSTLESFAEKMVKNGSKNVTDVFNVVLLGAARRNDVGASFYIIDMMKRKSIQPNLATISALLQLAVNDTSSSSDCGFFHSIDCKKIVEAAFNYAEENHLKMREILARKVHGLRETDNVLSAARLIDSKFEPADYVQVYEGYKKYLRHPSSVKRYNNNLLSNLNVAPSEYLDDGPYAGVIDAENLKQNFQKNFLRESENRLSMSKDQLVSLPVVSAEVSDVHQLLVDGWKLRLRENFKFCVNECSNIPALDHCNVTRAVLPFLTALDVEEYVNILYDFALSSMSLSEIWFNQNVAQVKSRLANEVFTRFSSKVQVQHQMDEKMRRVYEEYVKYFDDDGSSSREFNQREFWMRCALTVYPKQPYTRILIPPWPFNEVLMDLGDVLLRIIMKSILVPRGKFTLGTSFDDPAFYEIAAGYGAKLRKELKVNPKFVEIASSLSKNRLFFDSTECPMTCPPIPWVDRDKGYFLLNKVNLVRTPGPFVKYSSRVKRYLKSQKAEAMFPALDSLNQLGATPWRVNGRVLDVAMEIFRTGKGDEKLDIPADVSTLETVPKFPILVGEDRQQEVINIHRERRRLRKLRAETFSLWSTVLYRLSMANYFRNEIVWFPHSLDFRGRAYPCPPHLNHMGDDLCRGILTFAKGRELGEKGLDWLKIHCINLTGLKKRESLTERLGYADEIIDDILDSADRPMTGGGWWRRSEEPWQTLACCMEIADALRFPLGPTKFVSRFPVHQDGSCNGLQHYAALGRDEEGARQVNLVNSEKPQDVYTCVAELVEEKRLQDVLGKNEHEKRVAKICEGYVRRKVIKQTVMTITYGVTSYGARLQIEKQLKALDDFPKEHLRKASSYLASSTFASIGALFKNTRKIQKWLERSADLLADECQQPVVWTTPLGFPVFQPYFKEKPINDIKTKNKSDAIRVKKLSSYNANVVVPMPTKQRQAFPPNFIHSLDSTHMMMTALNCQHVGISYASVHDCFWTHPSTIDVMNRICRDEFVRLYAEPILENLSNDLLEIAINTMDRLGSSKDGVPNGPVTTNVGDDVPPSVEAEIGGVPTKENVEEAVEETAVARLEPTALALHSRDYVRRLFTDYPQQGTFQVELVKKATYFFS